MTIDVEDGGPEEARQLVQELELMLALEAAFDEAYGPAPRTRPTRKTS